MKLSNLKPFDKKRWPIISLAVSILLLATSYIGCGSQKANNKDLSEEVQKWKSKFEACDTAKIEISRINTLNESKLRDVPIPKPTTFNRDPDLQLLREQVHRNKLKQLTLVGDKQADSLSFTEALKASQEEANKYYQLATAYNDTISLLMAQLSEAKRKRPYKDSIKEESYTASYEIETAGTLEGFKLAVDAKPVLITRTINTPAPPPKEYSYLNNIKLLYSGGSTWETKFDQIQRLGIEYERTGVIGFRANANYLIENKDYEISGTVCLRPIQWGKKYKK